MSRTCSPRRCDREPPTVGCLANATRWHPRPAGAPGSATTTPTRGEARARGVDAHEASSPCLAAPPNSVRRAVGSAAASSALTSWRTIALKPQLQRRADSKPGIFHRRRAAVFCTLVIVAGIASHTAAPPTQPTRTSCLPLYRRSTRSHDRRRHEPAALALALALALAVPLARPDEFALPPARRRARPDGRGARGRGDHRRERRRRRVRARARRFHQAQARARLRRAPRAARRQGPRRQVGPRDRGRPRVPGARQGLRQVRAHAARRPRAHRPHHEARRHVHRAGPRGLRRVRHGQGRPGASVHGGRVGHAHVLREELRKRDLRGVRPASLRGRDPRHLRHAPRPSRRRAQGYVRGGAQAQGDVHGRDGRASRPAVSARGRRGRRIRLRHVSLPRRRVLVRAGEQGEHAQEARGGFRRDHRVRRPGRDPRRPRAREEAGQGVPGVAHAPEDERAHRRRRRQTRRRHRGLRAAQRDGVHHRAQGRQSARHRARHQHIHLRRRLGQEKARNRGRRRRDGGGDEGGRRVRKYFDLRRRRERPETR